MRLRSICRNISLFRLLQVSKKIKLYYDSRDNYKYKKIE